MKGLPLVLCILSNMIVSFNTFSQKKFVCSYTTSEIDTRANLTPGISVIGESNIKSIMSWMLQPIGLKPNFIVVESNYVSNAAALVFENKRFIVYNPQFFAYTRTATKTDWAAISILAHEIGHHLQGHTIESSVNHESELEADWFSGNLLYKLGATFDEACIALKTLCPEEASFSHPSKFTRLISLREGWRQSTERNLTLNEINNINPNLSAVKTNVELYNRGRQYFNQQQFKAAEKVFELYTDIYPEQAYGWYWRARSNWSIDTTMELGLANPHFDKFISTALASSDYKSFYPQVKLAYKYFVGYNVFVTKDYQRAIDYCNKILFLDPADKEAIEYKKQLTGARIPSP
jgi:tetratricopeptide (TPR) repeat protein